MLPEEPDFDSAAETPPSTGHARRLAVGTLAQQGSQLVSVLALFAVFTAVGRSLPVAALGVYGLVLSFVTYVVMMQGAASTTSLKAIATARSDAERERAFTTAVLLLAVFGLIGGLLIAAGGWALLGVLHVPHRLLSDARLGVVLLGVITFIGWPVRTYTDAVRGLQRYVLASICEAATYLVWGPTMLILVLIVKPPLWVLIAAANTDPVLMGVVGAAALAATRSPIRFRWRALDRSYVREFITTTGTLLVYSGSDLLINAMDRTILGLFRPVAAIARYEVAARPYSLLRTFTSSLVKTVLPASAQMHAEQDTKSLRLLLVRGARYVLAATLPLTVVVMCLARPIIQVWLGRRYDNAATAVTLFAAIFLVVDGSVTAGILMGVGRLRQLTIYTWAVGVANLALSLALAPVIGLSGVVIGTTLPYLLLYPLLLRMGISAVGVRIGELAREAWLPAFSLGIVLAVGMVVCRLTFAPYTLLTVIATGLVAILLYWAAYYAAWLRPAERTLIRQLVPIRSKAGNTVVPEPL